MSGPERVDERELLARIAERLERGLRVLSVDGAAGSGKTTLATRLAERFPELRLVRLDEVYPGWHGLDAGIDAVRRGVIEPLEHGEPAEWPLWDWQRDAPGETASLPAGTRILLEGCGASVASAPASQALRIWCEAPAELCEERFLARDGEAVRPWLPVWAAQWQAYLERERPLERVDLVIDSVG